MREKPPASAGGFLLWLQQFFHCHAQHLGKYAQLNISDKTLAAFNTLDCVFVHIQSRQLKHTCQRPLRDARLHGLANLRHLPAAKVAAAIRAIILVHSITPDIPCLSCGRSPRREPGASSYSFSSPSGIYVSTSSTLQSSILQISFNVAVEILRSCFKESNVPLLNLYLLINVYVVTFFLRIVSHIGPYEITRSTPLRFLLYFAAFALNIPYIPGIIDYRARAHIKRRALILSPRG